MCSCKEGDQSVDHILFDCKLLEHDRDRLKAAVTRSENWPVYKDTLSVKFYNSSKNSRKKNNIGQSIVYNQELVEKKPNCK